MSAHYDRVRYPSLFTPLDVKERRVVRTRDGLEGQLVRVDVEHDTATLKLDDGRFWLVPLHDVVWCKPGKGKDERVLRMRAISRKALWHRVCDHMGTTLDAATWLHEQKGDETPMMYRLDPRFVVEFVERLCVKLDDARAREAVVAWVPLALTFDADEAQQRPTKRQASAAVDALDPLFVKWDAELGWRANAANFETIRRLDDVRQGLVHIADRHVRAQRFCSWCHCEHEAETYLQESTREMEAAS